MTRLGADLAKHSLGRLKSLQDIITKRLLKALLAKRMREAPISMLWGVKPDVDTPNVNNLLLGPFAYLENHILRWDGGLVIPITWAIDGIRVYSTHGAGQWADPAGCGRTWLSRCLLALDRVLT